MGSSPCSLVFQVRRSEPELLTPANPTPREEKILSEIDNQGGLRFQVPFILSYNNNCSSLKQKDPVKVIREALRRALVHYYPLAGRVREGPSKKLFVDCNGQGIFFIEADADVTLEQLGATLEPPCPFLEDFLYDVPGSSDIIVGTPLLLVQVTRLKCGGFIVGLRVNHTMCDAVGLGQFLNAVGEIARGAYAPSIPPFWERELFNARDPPQVKFTHHEYGEENESRGSVITSRGQPDLVQRCFNFGPEEIRNARKHLPPHMSSTCSTFELITACLWKCRTVALAMSPDEVVRVSLVVNARGKRNNVGVPLGFYGNAIGFPCVVSTAELLVKSPLAYAVELVKKAKNTMNKEYIESVTDLLAVRGWPTLTLAGNNFILSDNTRTGMGEVDFGWGKPIIAGPAKSVNLISFYVKDNNQKEEYGILVPMCLPFRCMNRFEQELKMITSKPVEKIFK